MARSVKHRDEKDTLRLVPYRVGQERDRQRKDVIEWTLREREGTRKKVVPIWERLDSNGYLINLNSRDSMTYKPIRSVLVPTCVTLKYTGVDSPHLNVPGLTFGSTFLS